MIGIRTVCTHDGRTLANTLVRLLEAEEHQVRLTFGRQSLAELDAAQASSDAVIIIWSPDAPSQTYMQEWARRIAPERLVEIGLTPGWPRIYRVAPVIDFSAWRGERGARPWNALNERLRAVQRAMEPSRPPYRAALAVGLAGVAAVGVAAVVRVDNAPPPPAVDESTHTASLNETSPGLGGALEAVEPPSVEDVFTIQTTRMPRVPLMPAVPSPDLVELEPFDPPTIRDPTLLERLRALNPLRLVDRDDA
jgi:hypothetical protein